MGRYSSDSETSHSSRVRKSKKSSKRSSSRSVSPKRCKKKSKKYKRTNRSSSRDTKNKQLCDSKSRYRRRSRSLSDHRKKHSSSRSPQHSVSSRDGERKRRDDSKKYKYSKNRRRHRSTSSSSSSSSSSSTTSSSKRDSPAPRRKFDYDPDELLEKLNKAAVEAMAANKKLKPDLTSAIEMQIKRQDAINELRASGSSGILAQSIDTSVLVLTAPLPPPPPLLSTKVTALDDSPVVLDLNACNLTTNSSSYQSNSSESLLHPNFLLENQEEKLNRWIKKLYQIRQRAISGELISV